MKCSESSTAHAQFIIDDDTNDLFVTVPDDGTVCQIFGIEIVDDGLDPLAVIVDGYVAFNDGEVRFSDENVYAGAPSSTG